MIDAFKTLLRKDIDKSIFNHAQIGLSSQGPPPPSVPFLTNVLLGDHHDGPGLVNLPKQDAYACQVVGQLSQRDFRVNAYAEKRTIDGFADYIVSLDVPVGPWQDLVDD